MYLGLFEKKRKKKHLSPELFVWGDMSGTVYRKKSSPYSSYVFTPLHCFGKLFLFRSLVSDSFLHHCTRYISRFKYMAYTLFAILPPPALHPSFACEPPWLHQTHFSFQDMTRTLFLFSRSIPPAFFGNRLRLLP